MKKAVVSGLSILVIFIAGLAFAQNGGSDPAESRDHPALNRIPCYRAVKNNTKMDQSYISPHLKKETEWKGDVTTIIYKPAPGCTAKSSQEILDFFNNELKDIGGVVLFRSNDVLVEKASKNGMVLCLEANVMKNGDGILLVIVEWNESEKK